MTKTIRLTDIQLVILAGAAARDNGSLLPPPDTLGDSADRIKKVVEQLIKRGLAAEADRPDGANTWRIEADRNIGVIITDAGRSAINADPHEKEETYTKNGGAAASLPPVLTAASTAVSPRPSKTADVLALLQRPDGATLDELVAATNWLPHTTRAALTGLRKKGHAIERGKRDDMTCYTLTGESAA